MNKLHKIIKNNISKSSCMLLKVRNNIDLEN